ncbi:hypothetical protein HPB50_023269 [Hyalomma asiaticum]|uniref:Uncharacterized protein n=1 Tax=Hyalomma asiaticum TaxID=266040 RepID=A0ACB7S2U1_HYAAI|nr:hypothetical protein HPB50_023269 [Hyalomma asiaticum]
MAENRPSSAEEPADRGPPSPGAASHTDGSVFSDEGDKAIIAVDDPYNIPPVPDNVRVPPSPLAVSTVLGTVEQPANVARERVDPTYAPFRRATECQN